MPSLFKRSNGIFYFVQIDATGRRRWISTHQKSKQLALECIRRLGSSTEPKTPRCSLPEFSRDFLLHARSAFEPGTVDIYWKSLGHFHSLAGDISAECAPD